MPFGSGGLTGEAKRADADEHPTGTGEESTP
jgi:hypothetical protein